MRVISDAYRFAKREVVVTQFILQLMVMISWQLPILSNIYFVMCSSWK